MKKTLWISALFMFVFLVSSINSVQAQQAIISENDALMNNAKDRYEQFNNGIALTESEFDAILVPNQENLDLWNGVLAEFTREEIRAAYGGTNQTSVIVLDGRSNAYSAVRRIVLDIKRNM